MNFCTLSLAPQLLFQMDMMILATVQNSIPVQMKVISETQVDKDYTGAPILKVMTLTLDFPKDAVIEYCLQI